MKKGGHFISYRTKIERHKLTNYIFLRLVHYQTYILILRARFSEHIITVNSLVIGLNSVRQILLGYKIVPLFLQNLELLKVDHQNKNKLLYSEMLSKR